MDSRTDRSNAQRPLLLGALAMAILFAAAGAAVSYLGGNRAADACRRDVQTRVHDTSRRAAIDEAGDRAAEVRVVLDAARRSAEALAREAGRITAADAAPADTDLPDVPPFAPLAGRSELWTRSAAPGTFAVSREAGPAEQRLLALWASRLAPILRTVVDADAGIDQATVVFGGLGAVGAPAAWPAEAGRDARIGGQLSSDLDDWRSTTIARWAGGAGQPTYELPIVRMDGVGIGAVRVRISRAALAARLTPAAIADASSGSVLLTDEGAVVAWTPSVPAALGLGESGGAPEIRTALRPAVGGDGVFYPPPAGHHSHVGRLQFGAMRVAGVPFSVGVVAPDAPVVLVDPPSALAARRLGYATFALAVTCGLVALLGAVYAATLHARRMRPVLAAIAAHEAGDYAIAADVAGDDDAADVARWMNTAALRLRIAATRIEEGDRRIANLIDATADGFVTTDASDRITQVNQRFAELLHVPDTSLVGRFIEELLLPESVERWRNQRRKHPEGRPVRFEVAWKGGKSTHPRTLVSCVPLLDDDGSSAGRYVVVTDMTDRVRVHEEIARAEKVRALGEMAGGVAHDFNNVLTVILGNTQFLLLEDHPADVQQTLRAVERAALEGTETVRRIREFAKPRAVAVNAELVNPNDVISAVMDDARRRFEAEGKARGVEFNVRVERRSRRRIRGNAAEMREALANVVENALDAMPRGGKLTVEAFDRGEDAIAIRVEDTGVGMTAEQAKKVFDPFYTTKQGGRCPGLGLSIAFGIVRAHRGRIDLRTNPGRGTTFTIVLPAAAAAPAAAPVAGVSDATGALRSQVQPRVLLVGGEVGGMQPFLEEMRSLGVYVTSVHPASAHGLIASPGVFNTLVVDYELGATTGWEMARQARASRDDLRIVLLTTPANPVSETQAKNAGIDRVLVRPFDARDLHAEVFALLAAPRERSEAPTPASIRNRTAPAPRTREASDESSKTSEIWGPAAVRPATKSETGDVAIASLDESADGPIDANFGVVSGGAVVTDSAETQPATTGARDEFQPAAEEEHPT